MIDTERLRAVLERELVARDGPAARITAFARRPSSYRSSFSIDELDVTLGDGRVLALMFKDLGHQSALHGGHPVKPLFLHDPLREAHTYRAILASCRLGTAVCYGVLVDPERKEYGVFLERLEAMQLRHVGDFAAWQQAARWLAGLHSRFHGAVSDLQRAAPLLRYDGDFYRLWLDRFAAVQREAPESGDGSRAAWLAGRYERTIERLEALPSTFIHGEFYASNVLIADTAGGVRVCPVDWEMAAVGPGLIDLAALVAGKWSEQEQQALVWAYYDALVPEARPSGREELRDALECCRLHLAVQWLGWAPDWSPPPEHRQDWLAGAMELAGRLRL